MQERFNNANANHSELIISFLRYFKIFMYLIYFIGENL